MTEMHVQVRWAVLATARTADSRSASHKIGFTAVFRIIVISHLNPIRALTSSFDNNIPHLFLGLFAFGFYK